MWLFPSAFLCLTCTNSLALQHHSVENEADVLGGLRGARPLFAQQVEDLCGEDCVLTVLYELTQMGQAGLFALWVFLDDADDAVHNGSLVLKATLQQRTQMLSRSFKLEICETTKFNSEDTINLRHL